jgi:hypothetical protein
MAVRASDLPSRTEADDPVFTPTPGSLVERLTRELNNPRALDNLNCKARLCEVACVVTQVAATAIIGLNVFASLLFTHPVLTIVWSTAIPSLFCVVCLMLFCKAFAEIYRDQAHELHSWKQAYNNLLSVPNLHQHTSTLGIQVRWVDPTTDRPTRHMDVVDPNHLVALRPVIAKISHLQTARPRYDSWDPLKQLHARVEQAFYRALLLHPQFMGELETLCTIRPLSCEQHMALIRHDRTLDSPCYLIFTHNASRSYTVNAVLNDKDNPILLRCDFSEAMQQHAAQSRAS